MYFLRIECLYQGDSMVISQDRYVIDIFFKNGLDNSNLANTPMIQIWKTDNHMGELLSDVTMYDSLVGSL